MARPLAIPLRRSRFALALLLAVLGSRATDGEPDVLVTAIVDPARLTVQERPFAFSVDPTTPSQGVWSAGYSFGVGSGISADRPLPVSLGSASGSSTFSMALGATDRLAPFISATIADAGTPAGSQSYTAGLTWQVTAPGSRLRLATSLAGLHEGRSGATGATAVVAASLDQGPLRLIGNVRADKVFSPGRDAVDYVVSLGTAWRLGSAVRIGAEYVGQDLEETFSAGAEGGAVHAIGPTLALDLEDGRYQVAIGSGFGLTARSPRVLGRMVVAVNF